MLQNARVPAKSKQKIMAIDYTTIEEVINDFQLMIDDTSYEKEARISGKIISITRFRELTFDVEQRVKTSTMTVNSTTLQCTLPDDYVKIIKIGFKVEDDEVHPLGYNLIYL